VTAPAGRALETAVATLVTDRLGRIVEADEAAVRLLGTPHATLVEKPLAVYVALEDRPIVRAALGRVAAGESIRRDVVLVPRGRVSLHAALTAGPADGGVRWTITALRDTRTESRRMRELNLRLGRRVLDRTAELRATNRALEEESARLETVVHQLPGGVLIVEPSGELVLANERARAILGEDLASSAPWQAAGFRAFHLGGRPYEAAEWPLYRAAVLGVVTEGEELEIERRDGTRLRLAMTAAPVRGRGGRIVAGVTIFQDLTGRRRAEERDRLFGEALEAAAEGGVRGLLAGLAESAVRALADACVVELREHGRDGRRLLAFRGRRGPRLRGWTPMRGPAAELDPARTLALPIPAPRRTMVDVTLVRRRGAPAFAPEDRTLAAELGQRVAVALDNMLLRDRLAAEGRQLRALFERLEQGVVTVDRGLRVGFANAAARRALGPVVEGRALPLLASEPELGELVLELFRPDSRPSERALLEFEGRRYEVTGLAAGASAETVTLVFVDLTAREAREQAERELVTNAAHELRTPVAAIVGAVEVLQSGAKAIPQDLDRFLGHIEREAGRLRRLTRALLVLARAQTGEERVAPRPVDLARVLKDVSAGVPRAPEVDFALICPETLTVHGDRDLLEQALANLLENAAKHTAAGRIAVTARQEDGEVVIDIADSGPGIDPHDRERIFERFYRGGDRGGDGFGLGLSIASQAVQALGGNLEIASSGPGGTTMRVTLPA